MFHVSGFLLEAFRSDFVYFGIFTCSSSFLHDKLISMLENGKLPKQQIL